uniref:Apolipoprotein A5 n=1 Tax=Suricata suricatta TaxID=37032 RepID=A0A673UUN6_SURSU
MAALLAWALVLLPGGSPAPPQREGVGGGWTEGPSTGVGGDTAPNPSPPHPSLSTAFASAQTQKGFWDYLSQSSRDKGKEEQLQRQKLAWEPTLKDSLEQDLSNIDKLLETLGPLRGQAREPPARRLDAAAVRQQLQEQLAEVRARLEPHMMTAVCHAWVWSWVTDPPSAPASFANLITG